MTAKTSTVNDARALDLICLGRAAVDLYSEQIGSPLEAVQRFARYLGGSPANTAVGAARLGLRVGMVSRVGNEQNGGFVREALSREGVDVSHLGTDPERLTALVFLGIKDDNTFPLLFYRQRCADMALRTEHIDPAYIGSARALLVSGTHLSHPDTREACLHAMQAARRAGTRVVLDIDYRPVLWGLTAPGLGEQRFVASPEVSATLQRVLPLCDLIVGTEEEIHIAGGSQDALVALRRIRELSPALVVMKRGSLGCVAYPAAIPEQVDGGVSASGFPVEVFNVLGAGDAFMAGLLRGWVRDEPLSDALRYANACGGLVVSRHGCAPAMPSWTELTHYLQRGSTHTRLREDAELEHVHRASTRWPAWGELAILAFDHRAQFEDIARRHGAALAGIARFKRLIAQAAEHGYAVERALQGAVPPPHRQPLPAPGFIVDERYGSPVLNRLSGTGAWLARPVEKPGSRPLVFEYDSDPGLALNTWPGDQVVKCLVALHPDDPAELLDAQLTTLQRLEQACVRTGHELLLELIPPRHLPADADTLARGMDQVYRAGVRPDWWKLPPPDEDGWAHVNHTLREHDPLCRGVLLLGLEATEEQLWQGFQAAAQQPLCRGFAVGRTLFAESANAWFAGDLDDSGVVNAIATRYRRLIRLWQFSRAGLPFDACAASLNSLETSA